MPCSDNRDDGFNYTKAMAKMEFQADFDKLTRMLCDATKIMEDMSKGYVGFTTLRQLQEYVSKTSPELVAWWKQHKKDDAKRLQSEAKKPVKKKRG